jgi:hypothetical protein
LGRAVIGGLLVATIGTLFVVPIIYSLLRRNVPVNYDERIDKEYKGEVTPDGKPVQGGGPRPQEA